MTAPPHWPPEADANGINSHILSLHSDFLPSVNSNIADLRKLRKLGMDLAQKVVVNMFQCHFLLQFDGGPFIGVPN